MVSPLLKSNGYKPRKGKVFTCVCGKEFYRGRSAELGQSNKYCSRQCHYNAMSKGQDLKCKNCGKSYHKSPSMVRLRGSSYCSKKCQTDHDTKSANTPRIKKQNSQLRSGKLRTLDNVFSRIVRERDGKCLKCGSLSALQCSHVVPRTYLSIRWDLSNAITLCYRCHIHWWHKHPLEASRWFEDKWPGRYNELLVIANQHKKVDRVKLLSELNEKLKEIKQNT